MLDWSRFESLSGAATDNFEKLCRGVVRRQFGFLGPLHELKNQPGVEYHMKLNQDHSRLGCAGQIVGWQCKWFQYRANGQLTTNARVQIEHSLEKTKEHLSELDHWFLWTHKTLAKPDQTWFYGLKSKYSFELHLWNESDLDELLSGPAIDLRHSYFGELALTPIMLAEQHDKSVAPVMSHWLHAVHQVLEIEHKTRQILGEPDAWEGFEKTACSLSEVVKGINAAIDEPVYQPWRIELTEFVTHCEVYQAYCSLFQSPVNGEHIKQIKELVETVKAHSQQSIQCVLRLFRRKNLPLSLVISNALAYIKDTKSLLKNAQKLLSQQLVAVVADAGGGKTQFAAELTSRSNNRSAGILLLGRDLKAGATLDSLAQRISFYNQPVQSFEALITALDAAGTRAGCRLPIVLDGLNEAQDPREWRPLLESIQLVLKKHANVVLICTLRTGERDRSNRWDRQHRDKKSRESFAQQALPDDCHVIESKGFDEKITLKAIKAYFKYYKIDADPYMAPLGFFSHPLNLKIFCEVTNREAKDTVCVAHFPSSIYSLFSEQVKHSAYTIAGMTNLAVRYSIGDIDNAIYFLGETLWEEGERSASEEQFRSAFNNGAQSWESDIVNLLSQEGLIFRDEISRRIYKLTPVYDRLGGYFVAYYLLEKNKAVDLTDWMQSDEFIQKLFGKIPDQHELSQDILHALVALTPKYNKAQVWQAMPSEYSSVVLFLSHLIDADDICSETKIAYKQKILEEKLPKKTIEQLRTLRTVVGHPFNADFLNDVLRELSVSDRDLSWTEYNRATHSDHARNYDGLVDYWRSGNWGNCEVERLRAVSISWLLTSSCIQLRDTVTEALFHYGLHKPDELFGITSSLLAVDDPYISERLLAASYGVIGTLLSKGEAQKLITPFAQFVHNAMFTKNAEAATTHLLAREYASCIIQAVNKSISEIFTEEEVKAASAPFPLMPRKDWGLVREEKRKARAESPFRMDFENYTIGCLVPGRGNYNYDHPDYKNIRNKILWRINDLGWNGNKFATIEQRIESDGGYSRGHRPKVERYGKKYSWIAYYEMAGQLEDEGILKKFWTERFSADIDPFFPKNSVPTSKDAAMFLGDKSITTGEWIANAEQPNLEKVLINGKLNELPSHWVLLSGDIAEESKRLDRNFYCSIQTLCIDSDNRVKLQGYIDNSNPIDWPDKPQATYIYSGELYQNGKFTFEENESVQVTIGSEEKEFERPQLKLNGNIFIEGGKQNFNVPEYDSLSVQIPVVGYYWEFSGSSQSSVNRALLAPWVVKTLGLNFNATDITYTDSNGVLAAVFIDQRDETPSNYRELFYLRKDLVESLLEMKGIELVSKVYGERRLSRTENFHSNEEDSIKYKDFEYISPEYPYLETKKNDPKKGKKEKKERFS